MARGKKLLDENQIIEFVCAALKESNHAIIQKLNTKQRGIDVIAQSQDSNGMLYIEAKGETSSRKGSQRFGKPYSTSQVFDRVAKGVYTTLELRTKHPKRKNNFVYLAVPDNEKFVRYLNVVHPILAANQIGIIYVKATGKIKFA